MILPGGLISLHSVNAIILPRSVEGIMFRTISAELSVSDSRLSIKSKYIHSITPSSFMPFQIPRFLIKSQILPDEHKYGDIQSPQIITNYLKKETFRNVRLFTENKICHLYHTTAGEGDKPPPAAKGASSVLWGSYILRHPSG